MLKDLKKGDAVRYELKRIRTKTVGFGIITEVFKKLGSCPVTYAVDTYPRGILFADEVTRL
jgi:hypothetical protein